MENTLLWSTRFHALHPLPCENLLQTLNRKSTAAESRLVSSRWSTNPLALSPGSFREGNTKGLRGQESRNSSKDAIERSSPWRGSVGSRKSVDLKAARRRGLPVRRNFWKRKKKVFAWGWRRQSAQSGVERSWRREDSRYCNSQFITLILDPYCVSVIWGHCKSGVPKTMVKGFFPSSHHTSRKGSQTLDVKGAPFHQKLTPRKGLMNKSGEAEIGGAHSSQCVQNFQNTFSWKGKENTSFSILQLQTLLGDTSSVISPCFRRVDMFIWQKTSFKDLFRYTIKSFNYHNRFRICKTIWFGQGVIAIYAIYSGNICLSNLSGSACFYAGYPWMELISIVEILYGVLSTSFLFYLMVLFNHNLDIQACVCQVILGSLETKICMCKAARIPLLPLIMEIIVAVLFVVHLYQVSPIAFSQVQILYKNCDKVSLSGNILVPIKLISIWVLVSQRILKIGQCASRICFNVKIIMFNLLIGNDHIRRSKLSSWNIPILKLHLRMKIIPFFRIIWLQGSPYDGYSVKVGLCKVKCLIDELCCMDIAHLDCLDHMCNLDKSFLCLYLIVIVMHLTCFPWCALCLVSKNTHAWCSGKEATEDVVLSSLIPSKIP